MITIDFETEGIEGNPIYNPPKPVGVSIKYGSAPSRYWAWGHQTGNNCSYEQGRAELLEALEKADAAEGWLAHNAPFECAVLLKWFDYEAKDSKKVHDTQYLLFLTDPYAFTYSLKPSAERILGLAPSEQDAVRDYLMAHQPLKKAGITISTSKDNEHFWARYICLAPGDLVGAYAEGDTDRTYLLYEELMPRVVEQGMLPAYKREQELMPILSRSSRRGVLLDVERLERDTAVYAQAQKISDDYIFSRLGDFDISKGAQLADALDRAGQITHWIYTPTGKRSTARKNLLECVKDKAIFDHLAYRAVLQTCLGTFANPWLAQAEREGGRLHAQWNQVRGERGADGDITGTRTGRLSCKSPNLTNIPNDFEGLVIPAEVQKFLDKQRKKKWDGHDVIHMRDYMLPDKGKIWVKRDFSSQEMRILAHFAEGALFEAFKRDPKTDPHVMIGELIYQLTGKKLPRKHVKTTGFGIMYGRGIPATAAALGIDEQEGKDVREAYFLAVPEVKQLSYETRRRGRNNLPIKTFGGRIYYREPNAERDLSYKLLNYLIQGSAADQSKESTIEWDHFRAPGEELLAIVHDEINIEAEIGREVDAMFRLRMAMDHPRFDVPFASEGFMGASWGGLESYDD